MIELHYWPTPNGHKVTMFLEEAGLKYEIVPVDIGRGEQFRPEFLKIAPNNRMPAIVDREPADGGAPVSVFELGAILLYLAEKVGRFIPSDVRGRVEVLQWLFWQMGGLGPMAGQNHHFSQYAPEKLPYAIDRYVNETNRLYGVLDTAAGRPAVRGRRGLLDRRHGLLSLDRALRAPGAAARGLPEPEALVRGRARPAGDGPGLRGRRALPAARRDRRRGVAQGPVRADRGQPAAGLSGAWLGGRAPDRLYPIDELGLWRLT